MTEAKTSRAKGWSAGKPSSARRVLAAAGFPEPQVVPEQAEPDPRFPTVSFPNPEEPGALDLALALAETAGADVVVTDLDQLLEGDS